MKSQRNFPISQPTSFASVMHPMSSFLKSLVLLVVLSAQTALTHAAAVRYFVSPQGLDSNPGTEAQPFATIERARDALRAATGRSSVGQVQLPAGWTGAEIVLLEGKHRLERPVLLDARDGGSVAGRVVYRGAVGATVVVSGGLELPRSGWRPLRDPLVRARVRASVRDSLFVFDLRDLGLKDLGRLGEPGSRIELLIQGQRGRPAQWPDDSWAAVGTATDTDGFVPSASRVRGWSSAEGLWMQGYWRDDSGHSWHEVSGLSRGDSSVGLSDGGPADGIGAGQWFRAVNVLEELDQPGEWWVDPVQSKLVLLPATEDQLAETELAVVAHAFVLEGTKWATIAGLRVEATRSHAVSAVATTSLLLDDVAIGNPGGWGVRVVGGQAAILEDVSVRGAGEGGILLSGGDRATLAAAEHVVRGAVVSEFGRVGRMASPGIRLEGVGSRVTGSTVEVGPQAGIEFTGNDHRIDNTTLRDLCRESGSAAAIVGDGDWTTRGTVIENNTFQHIRPVDLPDWAEGVGEPSAVRLASGTSGTTVSGNTILDAAVGVLVDGGRDNAVVGNTFTGTQTPVRVRAVSDTEGLLAKLQSALSEASFATTPTWLDRYPQIAGIVANTPSAPLGTTITANRATDRDELLDASVAARSGIAANQVNYASNGDETPLEDLSNLPPTDSASPYEGLVYYVATNGNDSAAGTAEAPFATIARARDAIRAATGRTQTGGPPPANWKGARVVLRAGTYYQNETLTFDSRDQGTRGSPIEFVAEEGDRVTITAAKPIPSSAWEPVTSGNDPTAYARIPVGGRGKVYRMTVAAEGIRTGNMSAWPVDGLSTPASDFPRLIVGDDIRYMSRYPAWPDSIASNWLRISNIQGGASSGGNTPMSYEVEATELRNWSISGETVFTQGSLDVPYHIRWQPVSSFGPGGAEKSRINVANKTLHSPIPANAAYLQNTSQFVCVRNALSAMTPGSYVWTPSWSRMYYWSEAGAPTESSISQLVVAIRLGVQGDKNAGSRWITFAKVTIEGARTVQVDAHSVTGVLLRDCIVQNGGYIGIRFWDSNECGIEGGSVRNFAQRAIRMHGGDELTQRHSENYIRGVEINNIGFDLNEQISTAISMGVMYGQASATNGEGFGLRISDVTMRDIRDGLIGASAGGLSIEDCLFERFLQITGDAGGITGGFSYTHLGNSVRRSVFRDSPRLPLHGRSYGATTAIYLDKLADWTIEDCVFDNLDHAIFFGGKRFSIQRNSFRDCHGGHWAAPVVALYRRWNSGAQWAQLMQDLGTVDSSNAAFSYVLRFRESGDLFSVIGHHDRPTIRDNVQRNAGFALLRMASGDPEGIEAGVAVGISLEQLNYPTGWQGLVSAGGGSVALSAMVRN
jgi:hypothetical protein